MTNNLTATQFSAIYHRLESALQLIQDALQELDQLEKKIEKESEVSRM